jgi:hypothetical protein
MDQKAEEVGADTREADRAVLAAMAAEEAPPMAANAAVAEPEGPPRMDAVESLKGLLSMLPVAAEFAGARHTAAVWNPESCDRLAQVTVPVLRKYPWGAPVLAFLETGTGAEEVALAMTAIPMAIATWQALKADSMAARKPAEPGGEVGAEAGGQ